MRSLLKKEDKKVKKNNEEKKAKQEFGRDRGVKNNKKGWREREKKMSKHCTQMEYNTKESD